MFYTQNLHTHTNLCDGADSPEELIRQALDEGLTELGFSEHVHVPCLESDPVGAADRTTRYKAEIRRLQKVYAGQIDIFCGIEHDIASSADVSDFDFTIIGVHYLKKDGVYYPFHRAPQRVREIVDEAFGGDGLAFAKAYYEAMATIPDHGRFDIVGHFDSVTRNVEKLDLFDPADPVYLSYAMEALHALANRVPFFEVNTGSMARGYRHEPYPSLSLMREMHRMGIRLILSSDCHDKRLLTYGFEESAALLKEAGYREIWVLKRTGFQPIKLP